MRDFHPHPDLPVTRLYCTRSKTGMCFWFTPSYGMKEDYPIFLKMLLEKNWEYQEEEDMYVYIGGELSMAQMTFDAFGRYLTKHGFSWIVEYADEDNEENYDIVFGITGRIVK